MREEYYIWSYEHNAWWKPERMGYTANLRMAGLYPIDEARDIVFNANGGGKCRASMVKTDAFQCVV